MPLIRMSRKCFIMRSTGLSSVPEGSELPGGWLKKRDIKRVLCHYDRDKSPVVMPRFTKALIVFMLLAFLGSCLGAPYKVLVFSYTAGFRHDSITNGLQTIQWLASTNGFSVDSTE